MGASGLYITAIKLRALGSEEKRFYKFTVEFNNVLQINGTIMYSQKNQNWFVSWPSNSYVDKTKKTRYENLVVIDNKSSREQVERQILTHFNGGNCSDYYSPDSTYIARQEAKKQGYQNNQQPQQQYQQAPQNYQQPQQQQYNQQMPPQQPDNNYGI